MQAPTAAIYRNSGASTSVKTRHALGAWLRAKHSLQGLMQPVDFRAFVRPMYLMGVLSHSFMLIALPPNQRVVERARNFRENLKAAIEAQGYNFAGFTPYPSDDVVLLLRNDRTFGPFMEIICRERLRRLELRRGDENARDAVDLTSALEGRR